jgi:putative transposase
MPNDFHRHRHLPHQVPAGFPIFLNWNLKGAVSKRLQRELELEVQRLNAQPKRAGESVPERRKRHAKLLFKKRDVWLDHEFCAFLQNCTDGTKMYTYEDQPMWLADPEAAMEVVKSFVWGVDIRYQLWAFVVMGNHVHILLTPKVDLEVITQGIKGYTAYQINRLQSAVSRVFWQDESYDHWARDDDEFFRIIHYIEQNPVVAGLCGKSEDWRWSSAWYRSQFDWPEGEPFPGNLKDQVTQQFGS